MATLIFDKLLLLGPMPLQRGGWFVAGWLSIALLAVTLLPFAGLLLFGALRACSVSREPERLR